MVVQEAVSERSKLSGTSLHRMRAKRLADTGPSESGVGGYVPTVVFSLMISRSLAMSSISSSPYT